GAIAVQLVLWVGLVALLTKRCANDLLPLRLRQLVLSQPKAATDRHGDLILVVVAVLLILGAAHRELACRTPAELHLQAVVGALLPGFAAGEFGRLIMSRARVLLVGRPFSGGAALVNHRFSSVGFLRWLTSVSGSSLAL